MPCSASSVAARPVITLPSSPIPDSARSSSSSTGAPMSCPTTATAISRLMPYTARPVSRPVIPTIAVTSWVVWLPASSRSGPRSTLTPSSASSTSRAPVRNGSRCSARGIPRGGWRSACSTSGANMVFVVIALLLVAARLAQHLLDGSQHALRLERLDHEVLRPRLHRFQHHVLLPNRRHHRHLRSRVQRPNRFERPQPVQLRHGDVHHHRVPPVLGFHHRVSVVRQHAPAAHPHERRVVRDQDRRHGFPLPIVLSCALWAAILVHPLSAGVPPAGAWSASGKGVRLRSQPSRSTLRSRSVRWVRSCAASARSPSSAWRSTEPAGCSGSSSAAPTTIATACVSSCRTLRACRTRCSRLLVIPSSHASRIAPPP